MTPQDLLRDLESTDRATVLAAIEAAPHCSSPEDLLGVFAQLAGGPERRVALSAASAAQQIALQDRRWRDIDGASVIDAQAGWLDVATDQSRWADVRVYAMEIAKTLRPETDLLPLCSDDDPQIRAAAIGLLTLPLALTDRSTVAKAIAQDPDPAVAVAAAQTLCQSIGAGDDPVPLVATLDERGVKRLRELVADNALPAHQRLDAARCALETGDQESARDAVLLLIKSAPPHLAKQAKVLLSK
jgi:hypothetical protein